MAVNKNFVVKNGLEVDTNTLFVDSANNRVAIGTTVPTATLDVRGKIKSDSQVDSWVGKFVGIVTAGAVGVTTMTATDAVVSGFSTLGYANATSLKITTGFSTVQALSSKDLAVSIGATITKDFRVGGGTTLTGDLSVGAAATVTGIGSFSNDVEVAGDFRVGTASTMMVVQGVSNTGRVGIGSMNPAYRLDVLGDINSSTDLKIDGTSVLTTAAGDATALAIALG